MRAIRIRDMEKASNEVLRVNLGGNKLILS